MQVDLESKLTEAQKKYARLIKQGESKLSRANGKFAEAQRKLNVNQTKLEEINEQLKHTKLFAPVDGIALYPQRTNRGEESIAEGIEVRKNRSIISIPSLQKMKVEVKIPEFHISKIKPDLPAFVTLESISDTRYNGTVTRVNHLPDRNNSWYGATEQFYSIEILITDPLPDVKPSISATTTILIDHLQDVMSIPLQAIVSENDTYYCYVKDGSEHIKKEIQLGMQNNSFAHITSGLTEGDEVLLNITE
jgi:hypothetical protein